MGSPSLHASETHSPSKGLSWVLEISLERSLYLGISLDLSLLSLSFSLLFFPLPCSLPPSLPSFSFFKSKYGVLTYSVSAYYVLGCVPYYYLI